MATFNLADYETVEERIRRFYSDNPKGRIITDLVEHNIEKGLWVTMSHIFMSDADIDPKASGLAYELDSMRGPQQSSALEVCETSSIGRALANAGYSGNRRASRTEMEKVERYAKKPAAQKLPLSADDETWIERLAKITTLEEARTMYKDAQKSASKKVLDAITLKADTLK